MYKKISGNGSSQKKTGCQIVNNNVHITTWTCKYLIVAVV